jgi:hypothetical protein
MTIQHLYDIIIQNELSYIIIDKLFENRLHITCKIKTLFVLIYYENILLQDKKDLDEKYYEIYDNIIIGSQIVSYIIHKPYVYELTDENSYEFVNPYDIYNKIIQHIITLLIN